MCTESALLNNPHKSDRDRWGDSFLNRMSPACGQIRVNSANEFLLSVARCSTPAGMVWPLKKRATLPTSPGSFSLGEGAAAQAITPPSATLPSTTPRNTDTVSGPSILGTTPTEKIAGAYNIPKGYKITGSVSTSRPVVVDGELAGPELVAQEVYVRPGGTLSSPALVGELVVEGLVEGPVLARIAVEVKAGGILRGAVETPSLSVVPGGRIGGAQLLVGNR